MNYFNLIENNSDTFYKLKNNKDHNYQQKGGLSDNNFSALILNAIKEDNYIALKFLIKQKELISIFNSSLIFSIFYNNIT